MSAAALRARLASELAMDIRTGVTNDLGDHREQVTSLTQMLKFGPDLARLEDAWGIYAAASQGLIRCLNTTLMNLAQEARS